MQIQDSSKIKDVMLEKYEFDFEPSLEGPLIVMDRDLTVGEFVKSQNELRKEIDNYDIAVDIRKAVTILGAPSVKKLSLESAFYYNWSWAIALIISIILFFFNWIYGAVFVIATIKEMVAPFNRNILRKKIIEIALTDYEALYMLMCTRSMSLRARAIKKE